MLEKITRREFVKKVILYTSGMDLILLSCGKKGPTEPELDTEAPVARIKTNKTSGYSPLTVNFDASGSTDNKEIVSYSWNFGDDNTGTGKIVNHTYGSLQKTAKIFKNNDSIFEFKDGIWRSYSSLKPDFLNTLTKQEIEKYSLFKTGVYGKFTTELTVKDAADNTDKATIDIYVNEKMPDLKPSEYWGKVNNGSIADNLNVEGFINNEKYSQYSRTKSGYYDIIVIADNPGTINVIEGGKVGDKIQVKIDNKNASPLLDFKSGSNDQVDLTY